MARANINASWLDSCESHLKYRLCIELGLAVLPPPSPPWALPCPRPSSVSSSPSCPSSGSSSSSSSSPTSSLSPSCISLFFASVAPLPPPTTLPSSDPALIVTPSGSPLCTVRSCPSSDWNIADCEVRAVIGSPNEDPPTPSASSGGGEPPGPRTRPPFSLL